MIYEQLQQFQAQWIHPAFSGRVNTQRLRLQAFETAVVTQTPHYTGLLDATNFDRFDWDESWHVALHMGIPVTLIVVLNT